MQTPINRGSLGARGILGFSPELQAAEELRRQIAQWFYAAQQCRIELTFQRNDESRLFLSSLISWGEWAQVQVKKMGIDLASIGIKPEDLEAETRLLRDTSRSAFENCLSEKEADDILKEVFG